MSILKVSDRTTIGDTFAGHTLGENGVIQRIQEMHSLLLYYCKKSNDWEARKREDCIARLFALLLIDSDFVNNRYKGQKN